MVSATTIVLVIFLVQGVGQYLLWLYWLQVKEYRTDRFLVFLKSYDGATQLLLVPILLKFLFMSLSNWIYISLIFYSLEIFTLSTVFVIHFLQKTARKFNNDPSTKRMTK